MGILVLLLLVVSLAVFIYLLVITARGWGALHVTMLCFLFVEGWLFLFASAGVHRERIRWLQQVKTLSERLQKAEADVTRLTFGTGDTENVESVVPARGMLQRLTSDRGRVWRRLSFRAYENNLARLEAAAKAPAADDPAADPSAPAAPAQPANNAESLPANMVVHAFAEETQGEMPVPNFYLGEFVVTENVNGSIALRPTLKLNDSQVQRMTSGAATSWTLYELLPQDSHNAFAAPGSKSTPEELWGHMDEAELKTIFAGVPDERRDALIDRYLRDGTRAKDSDLPRNVWTRVKLLKEYTIDVDSNVDAKVSEGYFDTNGRSVDVRLKRGDDGTVKLNPETVLVLKSEDAEKLIASGTAEKIEPIFVRPLVNYQYAFQHNYVRLDKVKQRTQTYVRQTEDIKSSVVLGRDMISAGQVEGQKLGSDLSHYQDEVKVLNEEIGQVTSELTKLKATISAMYRGAK